jgi:hypothetical protein
VIGFAVALGLLYAGDMARDRASGWWQQVAIWGAVLLALAGSFCPVSGGHAGMADSGMSPDVCLMMLAVPLTVTVLWRPLVAGWAATLRSVALATFPIHGLDPPPRSPARFQAVRSIV